MMARDRLVQWDTHALKVSKETDMESKMPMVCRREDYRKMGIEGPQTNTASHSQTLDRRRGA